MRPHPIMIVILFVLLARAVIADTATASGGNPTPAWPTSPGPPSSWISL